MKFKFLITVSAHAGLLGLLFTLICFPGGQELSLKNQLWRFGSNNKTMLAGTLSLGAGAITHTFKAFKAHRSVFDISHIRSDWSAQVTTAVTAAGLTMFILGGWWWLTQRQSFQSNQLIKQVTLEGWMLQIIDSKYLINNEILIDIKKDFSPKQLVKYCLENRYNFRYKIKDCDVKRHKLMWDTRQLITIQDLHDIYDLYDSTHPNAIVSAGNPPKISLLVQDNNDDYPKKLCDKIWAVVWDNELSQRPLSTNLDQQGAEGTTFLQAALDQNNLEALALLIWYGADLKALAQLESNANFTHEAHSSIRGRLYHFLYRQLKKPSLKNKETRDIIESCLQQLKSLAKKFKEPWRNYSLINPYEDYKNAIINGDVAGIKYIYDTISPAHSPFQHSPWLSYALTKYNQRPIGHSNCDIHKSKDKVMSIIEFFLENPRYIGSMNGSDWQRIEQNRHINPKLSQLANKTIEYFREKGCRSHSFWQEIQSFCNTTANQWASVEDRKPLAQKILKSLEKEISALFFRKPLDTLILLPEEKIKQDKIQIAYTQALNEAQILVEIKIKANKTLETIKIAGGLTDKSLIEETIFEYFKIPAVIKDKYEVRGYPEGTFKARDLINLTLSLQAKMTNLPTIRTPASDVFEG